VKRLAGSHKLEANGSDFSTMPCGMKLCQLSNGSPKIS